MEDITMNSVRNAERRNEPFVRCQSLPMMAKAVSIIFLIFNTVILLYTLVATANMKNSRNPYRYGYEYELLQCFYLLYIASMVHLSTSVYLTIACWKKLAAGCLAWLFVTLFILYNFIMLQFFMIFRVRNNQLIWVALFLFDGFVVSCCFVIWTHCNRNMRKANGLSNYIAVNLQNEKNCAITSLEKRLKIIAVILLVGLCCSVMMIIQITREIPVVELPMAVISAYIVVSSFMLVGVCKKISTFIAIWMYFTEILIVGIIAIEIFLLNAIPETQPFDFLMALMFFTSLSVVMGYFCLVAYSYNKQIRVLSQPSSSSLTMLT